MTRPRAILKHRKAVGNIHKLTRTMQLIATSKFQRAHRQAAAFEPYADKTLELASRLIALTAGRAAHPLLAVRPPRTVLLVVLTGDRGLCGGYHEMVLRAATDRLEQWRDEGRQIRLHVVGHKGANHLRARGWRPEGAYPGWADKLAVHQIDLLAERLIETFVQAGGIDAAHVVGAEFVRVGVQRVVVAPLLPLGQAGQLPAVPPRRPGGRPAGAEAYDLWPTPASMLDELLPLAVKVLLRRCFSQAALGEQSARMTAMKQATDNAEEMIDRLTRQYNRARQEQITEDLSEIVGGAEALA